MATSQDHKRVGDGDTGPNTGGMGAYSPAPVVTAEVHARVMREVVKPTVQGMIADGIPFTGFLYAGLMIDADGAPKVIEFNVRFGDPETQPVMLRLQSDLVDLVEAAIDARLHDGGSAVGSAPVAGRGDGRGALPGNADHRRCDPRAGRGAGRRAKVFHAGTALDAQGQVRERGRPRAVRGGAGRQRRRCAGQRVCRRGDGHLGQRVPPQRHRLARDRAGEVRPR